MSESILQEEWKPVVEFEGLYEVSNLGKVRSLDRIVKHKLVGSRIYFGRILKPPLMERYPFVVLSKRGKRHQKLVHRLVLEAFVGPCPPGMECCHDPDPNPKNNALANLRWDTRKANAADAVRQGRSSRGERRAAAKLTDDDVRSIRKEYCQQSRTHGSPALAKKYRVSQHTIWQVITGKGWKHVT